MQIGRGENKGQTVTYTNVVRGWIKLGEWNGQAKKFSKPLSEIRSDGNVDAYVVVVQGGRPDSPGSVHGTALTSASQAASN